MSRKKFYTLWGPITFQYIQKTFLFSLLSSLFSYFLAKNKVKTKKMLFLNEYNLNKHNFVINVVKKVFFKLFKNVGVCGFISLPGYGTGPAEPSRDRTRGSVLYIEFCRMSWSWIECFYVYISCIYLYGSYMSISTV